jgi:hypothetical protein
MNNKCAPGKTYTEGSCFSFINLKKIAEEYNKDYPSNQIIISNYHNKKALLRILNEKFMEKYKCENENQVCWASSSLVKKIKDTDIHYTFRPKGPNKQFEWLSTRDIDNVMKQYEYAHKDFKFLGAMPSDFDDLPIYGTTDLNFSELERKTHKLGAVINLDTHDQTGYQWVGLFINLKTNSIYYFDSFKKKPQTSTRKFVTRVLAYMANKKQDKTFDIDKFMNKFSNTNDYDVRYNKIQHQFKNSECGIYSMNFVIRLLEGETFDSIVNNITNDSDMNQNRKIYFRNANF